jgi:hypothetical protein
VTVRFIIVVVAEIALAETRKLRCLTLDGKLLDIRKNPHAIDVGSKLDIAFNYWFITWMET